ncbi:MAG: hypothetical protein AABW47_03235 [Nanoarchaeota archaeon]
MKILFICKYNAFRSRIAEEYFNKINKNPKITVISRGLLMGGKPDKEAVEIPKKILGINIIKRKPLPVKIQELIDVDLIVVVANDIPKKIFDYQLVNLKKKLVIWKIKDEQNRNIKNIKKITLSIKRKVDKLNRKLEKRK